MPDEPVLLTATTPWGVRLTLNRPAKLNALNGSMMAALLAALDAAESDPEVRVIVLEGVNVRDLTPDMIGGAVEFVTADLSFISLRLVAPALLRTVAPGTDALFLVKPQFEAGPERVGRGGVVRDPAVQRDVLVTTVAALDASGWGTLGVIPSPIRGAAGNVEFLLHLCAGSETTVGSEELERAVDTAHEGSAA